MTSMPALTRPHEQVLEMGGNRWFLATMDQAQEMGLKRSWDVDWIAEQGVDRSKPFVLDLDTFHGGYGYSHASIPGVYDRASGFDLSTPGKARTWPVLNVGESFNTVVDYRGWVLEHGGYTYVLRGRYIAKYRASDTPGTTPAILAMHQVGSGMAVAGVSAAFGGDLYVPIVQTSDNVLQRFHRLSTVSTEVTEVQTIVMSGTPTSGTYTVSFNDGVNTSTTSALAYNADQAAVQAALRLLPGLQKITVVTTGTTPNFTHTITMTAAPSALASTSPPQFTSTDSTSGGAHAIAHATTVAGTTDQWDRGPANILSRAFTAWFERLVRAEDNNVSTVTADPMVEANWGAKYPVGDSGFNVTHLEHLGDDLLCMKADGLWSFDENAHTRHEVDDLINVIDSQNGIGAMTAQAALFMPHRAGFLRWRPGAFAFVGAEQEGYLEGDVSEGWGRVMGVAPFGKIIYYTVNDTRNVVGALSSLRPGGRAVGFIPHMSHLFSTEVEHCATISLDRQDTGYLTPSAPTDDSAVGTVAWTNPGNGQYLDGVYATASGGTTHYLKALLPAATRVPDGATVLGVEVVIARRALAAPSFVNTATSTGSSGSITINVPAAVSNGDFLLASIAWTDIASTPTGWTLLSTTQARAGEDFVQYWRIAASEPASYTFSGSSGTAVGSITAYRGVDAGSPIEVAAAAGSAETSGTTITAPTATSVTENALLVVAYALRTNGTFSTPSGMTERVDTLTGTAASTSLYDQVLTSPGASGAKATTTSVTINFARGVSFVLKPLGGNVTDSVVKLVRAGSVVGDNMALAAAWPSAAIVEQGYGGSGSMWGTTLTVAQANAADFGVVLSATATTGTAYVDAITVRIYYQASGAADPSTYIAVLTIDAAHTTVTPNFVKLARAGLDPANDPNISHAADDVEFYTSRYYAPDRSVSKVYRAMTMWLDLSPEANTPGIEVWASVDDGTEFQMLDGDGAAANFTTSGAKRLFFPRTAAAVGHWVQFRVAVPEIEDDEVGLDVEVRNVKVYGVYNPIMTRQVTMALILRQGQHVDGQREVRTPDEQADDLADLSKPQARATSYTDPETGETGYFDVEGPSLKEMRFKSGQQTLRTAVVRAKVLGYQ